MGASSNEDLQAQIDELVRQITTSNSKIDALEIRADVAEIRADAAESRADESEVRADEAEARSLIDREMIGDLQREGVLSQTHASQMELALKSSRTVGAAIGILMSSRQISEQEAFLVLKRASNDSNRKLRDLAAELVEANGGLPQEAD